MTAPTNRLDAAAARELVEAHRLNLGGLQKWIVPLYDNIQETAAKGTTAFHQPLLGSWSPSELPRQSLMAIVEMLKADGYTVDLDGGVLTISWGRMA